MRIVLFGHPTGACHGREMRSSRFYRPVRITKFTFNPFQENTYVLDNGTEALLIDPGCWDAAEQEELLAHLQTNGLRPVRVVLTHAHIDHVLGCAWAERTFGLRPWMHKADLPLLKAVPGQGAMFGLPVEAPPEPGGYIEAGDTVDLGDEQLEVRLVPGHAPGHIVLYHPQEAFVIAGDTLFQRSIGRTDLPGGDHETLLRSIREQLYTLPDDVRVYSGHGPETRIGEEKRHNPFVRG